ncbi:hypothetical protein [uncultured Litoreibacter sp.]|uniref:hypothetical protein n=1 Tax=uncultured Litoreibacter sp. TaxID=1392394 RepID=UPI002628B1DD|nr:hypothetical protein [uncultured Litoreibacter sp.]
MCGYIVVTHPIGMRSENDQVFMGFLNPRLCRRAWLYAIVLWVGFAAQANAQICYPPTVPFVPNDPAAQREFADLIRQDFETYIVDVQNFFKCLDTERARTLEEARTMTEEYRRFLQATSQ